MAFSTPIHFSAMLISMALSSLSHATEVSSNCSLYHMLKIGMSYQQTVKILGEGTKKEGKRTETYSWHENNIGFNASFENGKFQYADYYQMSNQVVPEKFKEAKKMKSLQAIEALLGKPTSTFTTDTYQYKYSLPQDKNIIVDFNKKDDKISSFSANMYCPTAKS